MKELTLFRLLVGHYSSEGNSTVKAAINLTHSLFLCWAGCRQYGFFSYMKDLFQCPDSVMAYLCVLYNVHKIPVGDDSARRHVEKVICAHPEVRQFYTASVQVRTFIMEGIDRGLRLNCGIIFKARLRSNILELIVAVCFCA